MKRWLLVLVCALIACFGCSNDIGDERTGSVASAILYIPPPQVSLSFTQDSDTTVYGDAVTFTVTVSKNSTTDLSGTINVVDNTMQGQVIFTQTVSGPTPPIVFQYSALAGAVWPGLTHDLHATYSGDPYNGSNDVALSHTVVYPGATETAVDISSASGAATQSANPSVYGEPIHVNLTVTQLVIASVAAITPPSIDGTVHLYAIDPTTALAKTPTLLSLGDCAVASGSGACDVSGIPVEPGWQIEGQFVPTDRFAWSSSTGYSTLFDVTPASTTAKITDSASPSFLGASVAFQVEVDSVTPSTAAPHGSVYIYLVGDQLPLGSAKLTAGNASSSTATVTVTDSRLTGAIGDYYLYVAYVPDEPNAYGNENFSGSDSSSSPWKHTVQKDGTTRTLTSNPTYSQASPWIFGSSITFTLSVVASNAASGTPTGSVDFYDGTSQPTVFLASATLAAGSASFATSSLSVGTHTILAVYSGDANHSGGNATLTGTVAKATPTVQIILSPKSTVFSGPVSYGVTVTGDGITAPTGTVHFYDGNTAFGTDLDIGTGAASFSDASLAAGDHTITVKYSGDAHYAAAEASDTLSITQDPTGLKLTTSVQPATVSTNVSLSAKVTATGAATKTPTGSVTFTDGASPLGTVALDASGVATLTTNSLDVNTHHITASFAGDASWGASSDTLDQQIIAATVTALLQASPNPANVNAMVSLTASFGSAAAGSATGSVDFYDGTTLLGTSNIAGGNASFSTSTLAAGTHVLVAKYAGDATHAAATASVNETINRMADTVALTTTAAASTEFGVPVPLTATVTSTSGTPTGTVTFKDGTTTVGSSTLDASGVATFTATALGVGTHALSAAYSGDLVQAPAVSSTLAHDVTKVATTVTIISSQTPSPLGGAVLFTATVSGSSAGGFPPSGSVSFSDGATVIGSGSVDASGVATFSTSSLGAGSHSITASYAGDTHFQSAVSAALTQNVSTTAATIKLSSSPNPSVAGDAVTLTATVAGSTTAPSGTVTFKSGTTTLGSGPLDATGKATLSTTSLPLGVSTISVAYSGDGTYDAGTASATQVVNKAPTTVTLAASTNSAAAGVAITFTVTVTSPKAGVSGNVELFDATTSLGTAPVNGGVATFTIATLVQGEHAITALFHGTNVYADGKSNVVVEAVTAAVGNGADAGASSSGSTSTGGGASSGNPSGTNPNTGTNNGTNTGVGASGNVALGSGSGSGGGGDCAMTPGSSGSLTAPVLLGLVFILARRRRKVRA